MRIECFTKREWLKIAEAISKYCPSEPLLEKLVGQIHDKTNLFSNTHDFLIQNNFNPIFIPNRTAIEKCKDGKGLTKRLGDYETDEGKGIIHFKEYYQKYILKRYEIKEKIVAKWSL